MKIILIVIVKKVVNKKGKRVKERTQRNARNVLLCYTDIISKFSSHVETGIQQI